MADRSVYVYAVGDGELPLPDVEGVDGTSVRALVEGPFTAVVSDVDPVRFGEEALRRSLEDMEWLEAIARAHDGVVAALGAGNPVAPMRMATIYLDDGGVRALLRERADELTTALDRLRGRTEWGVKAFAVTTAAEPEQASAPAADQPGTSYLLRRRAAREAATSGRQRSQTAAAELHDALAGATAASRRYPPQDPRLTGHTEEMVLNAAYLVDGSAAHTFRELVAGWDSSVLRLELTGPWAPYSFATLDGLERPEEREER